MQTISFSDSPWNIFQKFLFRFFLIYFVVYTFPHPLDYIPGIAEWLYEVVEKIWDTIVPWFGEEIIDVGYEITVKPNGSGDTTWNYVQILLMAIIALTGAVIWSVFDRNRKNYEWLHYWLVVFIRYYLGMVLISYGFVKIFKSQFPFPGLMTLEHAVGESSPMGLAWTFMGYSTGFNLFTGIGEALGGCLLLFRRTQLLGAFISLTVLSNIVVMNFCYDIPVKLFSLNLLIMTFFLLAKDMHRIANFLFFHNTIPPLNLGSPFKDPRVRKAALVIKILIIGYTFYTQIESQLGPQEWGDRAPKVPLYGLYDAQTFINNQDTLPPLTTDSVRWSTLILDWKSTGVIKKMNKEMMYLGFEPDTVAQTIQVYSFRDSANQHATWTYRQPKTDSLLINGIWKTDTFEIHFNRRGPEDFPLMKRPFNWINEYPFNR